MFDGGCRVPTIMWWPGTIPAGTSCDKPAMTIDLLPTIAHLIGAKLPKRKIDGRDIGPLLTSKPEDDFAEQTYALYFLGELQAVRRGRWKLHFPHRYRTLAGREPGKDGQPVKYEFADVGLELFDLKNDPGETKNVADAHPEIVALLQADGERFRKDLGDELTGTKGEGLRPAGKL
jgi:arylsulfatase A